MPTERILKALANQRRLTILKLLETSELVVTVIAMRMNLSVKATSKHLLILAKADILERRQESLNIYYRLSEPIHPIVSTTLPCL